MGPAATAEVSSLVGGEVMAPGRVPEGGLRVDLVPTVTYGHMKMSNLCLMSGIY